MTRTIADRLGITFGNQMIADQAFTGSFAVVQQGNSLAISYSPAGVPEIDLNAMGSVLAFVTGAFGLVERRRKAVA